MYTVEGALRITKEVSMRHGIPDRQFVQRLEGSSLVTARILYHVPDYKNILQEFIWQEFDLVPNLPNLSKFLDFWNRELDGPVESVEITHLGLLKPAEIRTLRRAEFRIH